MKLFQQDLFFSIYPDPEVRKRGEFLLALIDQLQAALLITSEWERLPPMAGLTLWDRIKLQTIMLAIERHGGHKKRAAKWLGISRATLFALLKQVRDGKFRLFVLDNHDYEKTNIGVPAGNPVDCLRVAPVVSR